MEEPAPEEPTYQERLSSALENLPSGLRVIAIEAMRWDDLIFGDEPPHDCGQLPDYYQIRGSTCRCRGCGTRFKWSDGKWEDIEGG